ncbi:hypothetical protein EC973_000922 [Apophysomyces ossiformis]|uniref:Ras guanine nucleotide exchange factor domain-containing protein n=1 Tax=Apophysomyces ossiformis TaxID=679940 RepID=A0A8H7BQ12_9FUNG|nr:hypothetical protein EC973_000922 [Apophysomyces ossiformis]
MPSEQMGANELFSPPPIPPPPLPVIDRAKHRQPDHTQKFHPLDPSEHYYDDPSFFEYTSLPSPPVSASMINHNDSGENTEYHDEDYYEAIDDFCSLDKNNDMVASSDSSYFSARSSSSHSTLHSILRSAPTAPVLEEEQETITEEAESSEDNLPHPLPTNTISTKSTLLFATKDETKMKHCRSEGDIRRAQIGTPAPSMPSLPIQIPPRTSSMCINTNNYHVPLQAKNSKSVHLPSKKSSKTPSKAPSKADDSTWNILRLKRNQSSITLKKSSPPPPPLSPIPSGTFDERECQENHPKLIRISEHGREVLLLEVIAGKLFVFAGTAEKLFQKLADETAQDLDYVDTYLLSHACFTDSMDLLDNLIARFHMDSMASELDYLKKWQRCIQVKVLNVISRWIKLQHQDFKNNPALLDRLELFIENDIQRAGFTTEANMIKESLDLQMSQNTRKRHSLVALSSQSLAALRVGASIPSTPSHPCISPQIPPRRPSAAPSLLSFVSSMNTPPDSPTLSVTSQVSSSVTTLIAFEGKEIARYLTLADFYIFKCITAYEYMNNGRNHRDKPNPKSTDYIDMLTKRANMLSHWVSHELCTLKQSKQRRALLRKLIEVAKLCLEWSNFHTSMVITMGLLAQPVQKLQDWQGLSTRDLTTFQTLQNYLDVTNNMSVYRQALVKAKAPTIPFFPMVLKDLTFYIDGNPTLTSTRLINFSKFRTLSKFIDNVLNYTSENYWFAGDLEYLPFFPGVFRSVFDDHNDAPLDQVADAIETRIQAAYNYRGPGSCEAQAYTAQ